MSETNQSSSISLQTDVRVYAGMAVLELAEDIRQAFARQIYDALGEGKIRGHMHQPELEEIIDSMKKGRFVLSVEHRKDRIHDLIATAHVRESKTGPGKEIGGVLNLQGRKGHGALVVHEAILLARSQSAPYVEALVAKTNLVGQRFFLKLEGATSIGERASNYVIDTDGVPVMMTVFDLQNFMYKGGGIVL